EGSLPPVTDESLPCYVDVKPLPLPDVSNRLLRYVSDCRSWYFYAKINRLYLKYLFLFVRSETFPEKVFSDLQCFRFADIYQMKVLVCVGVDVGFSADGEVEVDDREFAGPFFHPVEYFRRQYMYP